MTKHTLLYVDDEESNLRIFKDFFRREFNVLLASTAEEGMDILNNNTVDLILSDQRMPGIKGADFLKYTFENFPEINRILITGYSDIEAVEKAVNDARIYQYIQKPWKKESLLKVIKSAIKLQELEKENKRQKEELIIAKEKAEESDKLKSEFLRNIHHEIRTPMNAIMGFSEFLKDNDISGEMREQYINIIKNSGKQLIQIIDDILEIAALETKQTKIHLTPVVVNNLCEEIYSVFSYESVNTDKSLQILFKPYNKPVVLTTDKDMLYRVIFNLMENAIKFTDDGKIELGFKLDDNEVQIFVKDTGTGINKDDLDKVFSRFYQEDKELSKHKGGLGLGLSIAKENIELLGGNITVQSVKGRGSTFTISLPYDNSKKQTFINKESSTTVKNNEKKTQYRILIAEDELINYIYLETLLAGFDYSGVSFNTLHANNGLEAVELCKKNPNIDFVLMDIKMPVMDGLEATKHIKKIKRELPVIAQTAYIEKEKEAFAAGCDDFISKPINEPALKRLLERFIKGIKLD